MTAYLNGIAESAEGAPWRPVPDPYIINPALSAALDRVAQTERNEEIKDWHRIERKCHQALILSVAQDPVSGAYLQRTVSAPNLPLPGTRILFEAFGAAFGLEHWTDLINSIKLRRGQPISDFIGILDDTIGEVLNQGGEYTAAQANLGQA